MASLPSNFMNNSGYVHDLRQGFSNQSAFQFLGFLVNMQILIQRSGVGAKSLYLILLDD
jgi:hypothetical protein